MGTIQVSRTKKLINGFEIVSCSNTPGLVIPTTVSGLKRSYRVPKNAKHYVKAVDGSIIFFPEIQEALAWCRQNSLAPSTPPVRSTS